MDLNRWRDIRRILEILLTLPEEERKERAKREAGDDLDLYREVLALAQSRTYGRSKPTRLDFQEELTASVTRQLKTDPDALSNLLPSLHRQLRQLAARWMSKERAAHSWQPTDLVHEMYMRIKPDVSRSFESEGHFLSFASRIMYQALVDHARKKTAAKRGYGIPAKELKDPIDPAFEASHQVLELEEALQALRSFAPRAAEVIFLRFYGGMTIDEIAERLGIHKSTVKRDIRDALLFLRRFLSAKRGG